MPGLAALAPSDIDHPDMLEDTFITCPYCWESIELDIDTSAGSQTYTEDCSVCCRPIVVKLWVDDEGGFQVEAHSEDD